MFMALMTASRNTPWEWRGVRSWGITGWSVLVVGSLQGIKDDYWDVRVGSAGLLVSPMGQFVPRADTVTYRCSVSGRMQNVTTEETQMLVGCLL